MVESPIDPDRTQEVLEVLCDFACLCVVEYLFHLDFPLFPWLHLYYSTFGFVCQHFFKKFFIFFLKISLDNCWQVWYNSSDCHGQKERGRDFSRPHFLLSKKFVFQLLEKRLFAQGQNDDGVFGSSKIAVVFTATVPFVVFADVIVVRAVFGQTMSNWCPFDFVEFRNSLCHFDYLFPLLCDYIIPHIWILVNPFGKIFSKKIFPLSAFNLPGL